MVPFTSSSKGRVENKNCYGSLRFFNTIKVVLQIMTGVLGFCKRNVRYYYDGLQQSLAFTLRFLLEKLVAWKKTKKISVISDTDNDFFNSPKRHVFWKTMGHQIKITVVTVTA